MPRKRPRTKIVVRTVPEPEPDDTPLIIGRPLIEGSDRLLFPAFYREERRPVTFRSDDGYRSREEREEYACGWFDRVRKLPERVLILVPHHIYSDPKYAFFHTGWTLSERDGEIRTRQCVVFLAGQAVPIARADQGVLCLAAVEDLSAWDGRTSEQSLAQAA